MGYEVHITRRQHWLDEDGPSIALNEWLKVVHSDPEMHYEGPTKEEALAAGNFSLAVRLYYLQVIKTLSEQNAIAWSREKTNRDYLHETREHRIGEQFQRTSIERAKRL